MFPEETYGLDVQLMSEAPKGDFLIPPGVTQVFAIGVPLGQTLHVSTLHTPVTQDSTVRFWVSRLPLREAIVDDLFRSYWTASRELVTRMFVSDELKREVCYLNIKNLQNAENAYYLEIRVE